MFYYDTRTNSKKRPIFYAAMLAFVISISLFISVALADEAEVESASVEIPILEPVVEPTIENIVEEPANNQTEDVQIDLVQASSTPEFEPEELLVSLDENLVTLTESFSTTTEISTTTPFDVLNDSIISTSSLLIFPDLSDIDNLDTLVSNEQVLLEEKLNPFTADTIIITETAELILPQKLMSPMKINYKNNKGEVPLEISVIDANIESFLTGEEINYSYEDALPSTDLRYEITKVGVKESIILKDQNHPSEYKYQINLEQFDFVQDSPSVVTLYKKGGKNNPLSKLYTLSAPNMIDANGNESESIIFEIQDNILILTPDSDWLSSATYPVIIDPTIEITVLNVHSHPIQGDYWNVDFTTAGTADLTITPADQATIDDMEFTSLFCDGVEITPQIFPGDVIFYPNWSCAGVATVSHLDLKTGNHHLVFEFSNEEEIATSEAFNAALTWTGLAGDSKYSTAGNWSTAKVPSALDSITLDNTCTNCDMTIDVSTTTVSFTMAETYAGTVTQAATKTFTVNGTFSVAGGAFVGGDSTIDINGSFSQTGGAFTPTSATTTISRNFTLSSGTFNGTGKKISFDGSNGDTTSVTCTGDLNTLTGSTFYIGKVGGTNSIFTITSGCALSAIVNTVGGVTVDSGATLTATTNWTAGPTINNGTIAVTGTTWNTNGLFTNNGTVTLNNITSFTTLGLTNSTTINLPSATTFDINNVDLINDVGATITYGGTNINIERNFTQNGTFDITGKALIFDGSNGETTTLSCSGNYNTLTSVGSVTVAKVGGTNSAFTLASGCTLSATVNTVGDVTIDSGATLTSADTWSSGTTTISGILNAASGTTTITSGFVDNGIFNHNNGTVSFSNANHNIAGSSTFYNFVMTGINAARSLFFAAGTTQTIEGTLNLNGNLGNILSLISSSSGTRWNIDPQGNKSISYVNVKDSNNINVASIYGGAGSVDSLNNVNWAFTTQPPNTPTSLGSASLIDGSWTIDNTPTFTFSLSDPDAIDNVQYRIQVDDTADFSSVLINYVSVLAAQGNFSFTVGQPAGSGQYFTGSQNQTLSDSATYYWRVLTSDNTFASSTYATANSGAVAFKVDATAPTAGSLSIDATSATSLTASISGASDSGSGLATTPYIFYNTTNSTNSTATNSSSWLSESLTPNTQYSFETSVIDVSGKTSTTSVATKYTLANIPTTLAVVADSATQLTVSWNANTNPAGTEYFVTNETDASNSGWIADTSYVQSSLTCDTAYTFTVKARNADDVETVATASVSQSTLTCPVAESPVETVNPSGSSSGNNGGSAAVIPDSIASTDPVWIPDFTENENLAVSVLPDLEQTCSSLGDQVGWYGEYFDYPSKHPDMELPSYLWGKSFGDPLSKNKIWTTDWYNYKYFSFAKISPNLMFGKNYFPFDFAPKEINYSHSHYFGSKYSSKITVSVPSSYSFRMSTDDDSWLYIDGNLIMDNSGVHAATTKIGSVYLQGTHIVEIYFAERHTTGAHLYFAFTDPNSQISYLAYDSGCGMAQNNPAHDTSSTDTSEQDRDSTTVSEPSIIDDIINGGSEAIDNVTESVVNNIDTLTDQFVNAQENIVNTTKTVFVSFAETVRLSFSTLSIISGNATQLAQGAIRGLISIGKTGMDKLTNLPIDSGTSVGVSTLAIAPTTVFLQYSLGTQAIVINSIGNLTDVWFMILSLFQGLLTSLGLRAKRRRWGTVYDSRTKQPIDPAIVELIDAVSGKVLETSVTDLSGRFGFLDKKGLYRINVRKTHYIFPSEIVKGESDSIFDNIYRGELIEISKTDDLLTPNIPLDSVAFDWNQKEKQKIIKFHPNLELFIQVVLNTLFWLGFGFIIFNLIANFGITNIIFAFLYFALILLKKFIPNQKLWGKIESTGIDVSGLLLEISHKQIPQVVVARAMTNHRGKFFLKTAEGDYILRIKKIEGSNLTTLLESEVQVGADGVVNENIVI